jgi:hypothetical protein
MARAALQRRDPLVITRGASGAAVRAVQRRCQAGELSRLAPGIYVSEHEPAAQAQCVRDHWIRILGELVPGAVVSYRSAATAAPQEGVLILSHPTRFNRTIRLPGLRVALVRGPSALAGDAPLQGGALHVASTERMLLENLARRRGSDGRSLGEAAVRHRLEQILAGGGTRALESVRDAARTVAAAMGTGGALARLESLIDAQAASAPRQPAAALQPAPVPQPAAAPLAADAGAVEPDPDCMALLHALAQRLRSRPRHSGGTAAANVREPDRSHQAFVEAWFDCFDAGQMPPIVRAASTVLSGAVNAASPGAMRKLFSVFKLASSSPLCDSVPPFGEAFAQGLKARHALLLQSVDPAAGGRLRSGAGSERIEATLAAASRLALTVPEGLARAIFYSILLWRVAPFERDNEALAQLAMNAELSSVGQARIIVPARLRGRLQLARARLLGAGDAGRYVRLLSGLQHWSAALDYSDLRRLLARLVSIRAFDSSRISDFSEPP